MVYSQQERHEPRDIVNVDDMVPHLRQPSELDRARERRRTADE
jgi:hypothetical protein